MIEKAPELELGRARSDCIDREAVPTKQTENRPRPCIEKPLRRELHTQVGIKGVHSGSSRMRPPCQCKSVYMNPLAQMLPRVSRTCSQN